MIIAFLTVFFLIHSINSNPLERDGNQICQLNGYFVPENGYRWAKRNNQIYCTCPDSRYEINRPCRICERQGICGSSEELCSEELLRFNSTVHFGCFCSSGLFLLGEKCPEDELTTVIPLTTVPEVTNAVTLSTTTTSIDDRTTDLTSTTIITTERTTVTFSTTTSTKAITPTTTSTTTITPCTTRSSSSSLFVKSSLIILLNLVYFVNK